MQVERFQRLIREEKERAHRQKEAMRKAQERIEEENKKNREVRYVKGEFRGRGRPSADADEMPGCGSRD